MNNLTATIFTIAFACIILLFGFTYLLKPKFLPYHGVAISKNWDDLNKELQTVILAFMRGISGGLISGGFTIIFLQYQFNKTPTHWIALTILTCGGILAITSFYAMYLVRTKTNGRPPIVVVLVASLLLIISYYFNISSLT